MAVVGGCDANAPEDGSDWQLQLQLQLKLPPELTEVSGLALSAAGTLLAVADEQALIFEINLQDATASPWLAIGEPPLAGDFEGIERVNDRVWLVDSDGVLLWSDGDRYEQIPTGLGASCEIEGLAQDPLSEHLMLLCKQGRGKALAKDRLYLRAVSNSSGQRVVAADLEFDLSTALERLRVKKLQPSGVAFEASGDRVVVVAARQKAMLVFSRAGALLNASTLPARGKHRQAEGVTILSDGRLVIADEGGKKRGRLSVYSRVF